MRKFFYLVLVLFFSLALLFSCNKKKGKDIMPKEKFVSFMVDIHLADGFTRLYKFTNIEDIFPSDTSLYQTIYLKHGVTKAKVDSTLKYYLNNEPGDYRDMCEQALNKLIRLEAKVNSEKERKEIKKEKELRKKK